MKQNVSIPLVKINKIAFEDVFEQSDGIVTLGGGQEGNAAQRVNQSVDMPNTEHNNWGVSNWTHPIFLQGGNGF